MKNFFRRDLNLNNKWWHRLVKVIFILFIGFMTLVGYTDFDLTGYSRVGILSGYINEKPQTVQEIINGTNKDGVILSAKFEPTNWKDGSWIVPRDAICANNLTSTVEYFESKGYEFHIGPIFGRSKVNSQVFLTHLQTKSIECIISTFYTGSQGEKVPMIQTYEDSDYTTKTKNIFLYVPNIFKTIWYLIFGTYFSNSGYLYPGIWFYTMIPSLILVFGYYKVILYIIFGNKKS